MHGNAREPVRYVFRNFGTGGSPPPARTGQASPITGRRYVRPVVVRSTGARVSCNSVRRPRNRPEFRIQTYTPRSVVRSVGYGGIEVYTLYKTVCTADGKFAGRRGTRRCISASDNFRHHRRIWFPLPGGRVDVRFARLVPGPVPTGFTFATHLDTFGGPSCLRTRRASAVQPCARPVYVPPTFVK